MENEFLYSSEEGIYQVSMNDYIKGSKYITGFWCCWIPIAVFGVTLVPVVTAGWVAKTITSTRMISPNPFRHIPIDVWCFYNCYSTSGYHITLLIQLFAQYVVATIFLATNILFPSFANVGVGQFRVLGCNYKNVVFTALLKFGLSHEDVVLYSKSFGASHWWRLFQNIQ